MIPEKHREKPTIQTNTENLKRVWEEVKSQDMVIGSEYMKGLKLPIGGVFLRYFLGGSFNVITKLIFWRLRGINNARRNFNCMTKLSKQSLE